MRLEAGRALAPGTVEAIRRLLPPPPPAPSVDDATLVRLALGDADAATVRECAGALLASPVTRARLRSVRGRLAGPTADDPISPLVARAEAEAEGVRRLLAEGRWEDASVRLAEGGQILRAGWLAAARLGEWRAVEAIARALLPTLAETGEREAFVSLRDAARAAARGLGSATFEAWRLSYEGVDAAFRGDRAEARELWRARLAICRREGLALGEADVLTDLAGLARGDGDLDDAERLLEEAERAARAAPSLDYLAAVRSNRALVHLERGLHARAAEEAVAALEESLGTAGDTVAVFARLVAVRALAQAGRAREALSRAAEGLERCVEAGRPVPAARILTDVAPILEAQGRLRVAADALDAAAAALSNVGARVRAEAVRAREAFRARHALSVGPDEGLAWPLGTARVARALREGQETLVAAR